MSVRQAVSEKSVGWFFGKLYPNQLLTLIEEYADYETPGKGRELVGKIKDLTPKLVEVDRGFIRDAQSASMLQTAALVLASYRVLSLEIGDEEKTIDHLQRLFKKIGRRTTKLLTWTMMGVPGNRMKVIEKVLNANVDAFGETFEYECTRNGDEFFEMKITGCFFYDYFRKNDVPRLTSVICAWDEVWMEEIDPAVSKHGIKADRPEQLWSGGDACRFKFKVVRGR